MRARDNLILFLLVISVVFLQEGYSYYISFQSLALACILFIAYFAESKLLFRGYEIVSMCLFSLFFLIVAINTPILIDPFLADIEIKFIAYLLYALIIAGLPHIYVNKPEFLLRSMRSVSAIIILALSALLLLSEFNIIDSLSRNALWSQNTRLITNASSVEMLEASQRYLTRVDKAARLDLFYGEPSFLAIVIFASLGSYELSQAIIQACRLENVSQQHRYIHMMYRATPFLGVIFLLYLQSLSSYIYALLSLYYIYLKNKNLKKNLRKHFIVAIFIISIFFLFSYEYIIERLTSEGSGSYDQRFGFMLDYGVDDLLLGVQDPAILPYHGIHNGVLYLIICAGIGGFIYLASFMYGIVRLSLSIGYGWYPCLIALSIMMQNGAVFSPNKIVLLALVIMPLNCIQPHCQDRWWPRLARLH